MIPTATLLVATVSILMLNSHFGDGYSGSGAIGYSPAACIGLAGNRKETSSQAALQSKIYTLNPTRHSM